MYFVYLSSIETSAKEHLGSLRAHDKAGPKTGMYSLFKTRPEKGLLRNVPWILRETKMLLMEDYWLKCKGSY